MMRATLLRSLNRTERGRRRLADRSRRRLTLETLEDRTAPAIFTVLNNADSGAGSLRQAILSANAAVGADTISFNIPGAGVHTISLLSALPAATGPLTIAGNTQDPLNVSATPLIELDGAAAGAAANGLILKAAGCVVRELVINGFQGNGLLVFGSNSVVEGCFVGTNAAGTASDANAGHGILVAGAATGVRIGGTTGAARNVISGNALYGVAILGTLVKTTRVQGNFIGPDVAGTAALGNAFDGVLISGGSDGNVIGGAGGARNVISGNTNGVSISGVGTTGNVVRGNFIGTDVAGTAALGNILDGVVIAAGATNNTVGGTLAGVRNVVSGNLVNGVSITGVGTTGNRVQGNFIGTDVTGTADLGNTVQGVLITAGAVNNTVGGTLAGARNVVSGNNATGVLISGAGTTGNVVQGNFIGTDVTGTADLGNSLSGVALDQGAVNNTIGGTVAGSRNVISGNDQQGVVITGVGTTGTRVQGNFIGTDVTGTADLGNALSGVRIFASTVNNTIGGTVVGSRNVIAGNNGSGVELLSGTTGNRVQGNFIGTNAAGTAALANALVGVGILSGASNNTIGGTVAAARNVISGNGAGGITITTAGTTGNLVQGNFIGTDVTGTADLGNTVDGIRIGSGTTNNTIGGTVAGARNVISGNNRFGILIHNTGTVGHVVRGNFIGLAANGVTALGNSNHGVFVADQAANTSIGGTAAGAGNSIAHNGGDGVLVGSDPALSFNTPAGSGNAVQGNRIFGNAGQGIDLGANDGPTANDVNDPDAGPNDLLNKPVLTSAFKSGTSLLLTGILNTLVNKVLRIEFFASPSGSQGQTFLGFLNLSTGTSTTLVFAHTLTVPASVLVGHQLTATMTDELGNTSEFSVPLTIE